jgi:hypothetical protein
LKSKTAPEGAVLIAGIAFIAVLATVIFGISRSAVITTEKTRAMSLADASAKSVATWYAQILNYDAYTNRAIAANEIMIAQAVTMVAWSQYAQHLAQNTRLIGSLLPPVQPITTWIDQAARVSHQLARSGAQIEIPLRSSYTRALQSSQSIMHAAATPFAAQAMVNEVIWTGDNRFFGQIIPSSNISAFSNFSKNRTGQERLELASLVRGSQDTFSDRRGFDQRMYLLPTYSCFPTSIDRAFAKMIRRGSTWLTANMQDWESADTLSLHTWRRRGFFDPRCSSLRESTVLGAGGGDANSGGTRNLLRSNSALSPNSNGYARARSSAVTVPGYLGLSAHRELTSPTLAARQNGTIRVPVLVRIPVSKIGRITAGAPAVWGDNESLMGNALWSLAVAETFYLRPVDTLTNSATREFANLFAPFWHARLVAPSSEDRLLAVTMAQARQAK